MTNQTRCTKLFLKIICEKSENNQEKNLKSYNVKNYTTAFFPDGQIMGKENICSCHKCLNGNLDKCGFEPGRIIKKGADNSEDFDKILIKLIAQSMSRMKLVNSRFFPISKKVRMLPYIHHLKPVNCFIFVKL